MSKETDTDGKLVLLAHEFYMAVLHTRIVPDPALSARMMDAATDDDLCNISHWHGELARCKNHDLSEDRTILHLMAANPVLGLGLMNDLFRVLTRFIPEDDLRTWAPQRQEDADDVCARNNAPVLAIIFRP